MGVGVTTGHGAPIGPTNPHGQVALRHVHLVSGEVVSVQGDHEKQWFETTRDKYKAETAFTEVTDLRDIDRLLILELMVYRWTCQLAAGVDYDGNVADEKDLQQQLKLFSDQITKLKLSMGLNKAARDAEANAGNFAEYITNLKSRAKAFGITRERQLTKAISLFQELRSLVGLYDRTDAEERAKLGIEGPEFVLDWLRDTAIPEFDAIDEYFRQNEQRYWIRDMK